MKVYNDNIKPEFTSFGKIAIGDTFAFEGANGVYVYIKIAHTYGKGDINCICLSDGRITGFPAEYPVRLIDCELYWKFRGTDKCEEIEE